MGGGHCEPLHLLLTGWGCCTGWHWDAGTRQLLLSMCLTEGVVAAANFGICLSLNENNYWELPVFQIVPWKRREMRRLSQALLSAVLFGEHGEATELWSWEEAEGCREGTSGSQQAGLGRKGPQRSRDLTCSFYRWETPDAIGKALAQGHVGGPS